jgi:hypothetical protein
VITPGIAGELANVITRAERSILSRIEQNRGRQEPDLASRLMENIELRSETIDGVTIILDTIDGLGRNAAENVIGADILGSIHIDLGGVRTSKGFLLQAKMSGKDKLQFRPTATNATGILDASHIFDRGPLSAVGKGPVYPMGEVSGTVTVTRPSKRLRKQCEDMLRLTPASFVLVFDVRQISVVSAAAVGAHRYAQARVQHDLGTKTLTDFFTNLADCFIGDERLGSATQGDLIARASLLSIPTALSLRITDQPA